MLVVKVKKSNKTSSRVEIEPKQIQNRFTDSLKIN